MKTENTIKKLGPSAKKVKAAKTRNSFRRALYHANKMIHNENSFIKNALSMKEFKREYKKFGNRTGMIKGKNLDRDLKTFLAYYVSNRTPEQCKTAADNLKRHLYNAVRSIRNSKGGIETISNNNQNYIKVLKEAGALRVETNEKGKTIYSIISEKIPNKEDFLTVNDKYLRFKRIISKYFGDQEYGEAYGS